MQHSLLIALGSGMHKRHYIFIPNNNTQLPLNTHRPCQVCSLMQNRWFVLQTPMFVNPAMHSIAIIAHLCKVNIVVLCMFSVVS